MSKFAWVTLTTNDTYSLGALVLAHSLKRASTAHQLAVLVTPGVSEAMRNRLKEVYNIVQEVNVLDSQDAANLALLARPELGITFTKLHCWKLVQFEKCVFLDADILVLQNSDELFQREELSAAPDISWPDCFNSGVFVFRPNLETYSNLTKFAVEQGSFDGGDQGLLNQYFSDWSHKDINKHLPFIYNTHAFASYSYLPAFKQFRDRVKILHFAGRFKPWLANFNSESKTSHAPQEFQHIADLIQLWWNIYCASVHPSLSDEMNDLLTQTYGNAWQRMNTQICYNSNIFVEHIDNIHDASYDNSVYDPWEKYYETLGKEEVTKTPPYDLITVPTKISEQIEESHSTIKEVQIFDTIATHNIESEKAQIENFQWSQNSTENTTETNLPQKQSEDCFTHFKAQSETTHKEEEEQDNFYTDLTCKESAENIVCDNTSLERYEESSLDTYQEGPKNIAVESNRSQLNAEYKENLNQIEISENLQHFQGDSVEPLHQEIQNFNSNHKYGGVQTDSSYVFESLNTINETEKSLEEREVEAGLAGALSKLILGEARTPEQEAYEQHIRRQCWESGNIDYCGRDSFENIWKKITQTLEAASPKTEVETTTEPTPQPQPERLTSADIEDGKIEFDPATNSTVTYRKIPKGYEVYIQTPQPNGTMKTQTKTFYDPVPVTAEELERQEALKKTTTTTTQKDSKKVTDKTVALSNPNTTVVVRKIPNGREEIYTTVNTDGTKSIQIKTFYDAEEEEITETTEVQQEMPGETRIITKQKTPNAPQQQRKVVQEKTENQQQLVETNKRSNLRRVNTEERTTEEVKYRSEKTVEETRKVSQTTEISGKSTTTKKSNIEEQSHHAITDQREKKKKTRKAPPPPIQDKPGEMTTVKEKQIKGGTEYHYTTQLEDGRTVTSVKTVYEEESTEMSAEEIKKYKKHLKEAEKHKNVTKTTNVPSKVGTKQIVPGENPGDVTTVETIKIEGGTEYRYTTVTAEGLVKKSSRTVYDPVPVEGDSEEEEIIEEYEEEIIEPGESVTETFTSTKVLPPKGGHVEVPAQKKKGKKSKN